MKTNEFVKKFGWELCIAVIQMSVHRPESVYWSMITDTKGGFVYKNLLGDHDNYVCIKDLKQLVESYELVESYGGLCGAKEYIYYHGEYEAICDEDGSVCDYVSNSELIEAIAEVESCQ